MTLVIENCFLSQPAYAYGHWNARYVYFNHRAPTHPSMERGDLIVR
jgi:hypothetical protein